MLQSGGNWTQRVSFSEAGKHFSQWAGGTHAGFSEPTSINSRHTCPVSLANGSSPKWEGFLKQMIAKNRGRNLFSFLHSNGIRSVQKEEINHPPPAICPLTVISWWGSKLGPNTEPRRGKKYRPITGKWAVFLKMHFCCSDGRTVLLCNSKNKTWAG